MKRILHRIRYNRFTLFLGIVWRPVTGNDGDTWLESWRKYRMDARTAWAVCNIVYAKP